MSSPKNVIERWFSAMDNQDWEEFPRILGGECVLIAPGGITLKGPDQVVGLIRAFTRAFPDLHHRYNLLTSDHAVIAEGEAIGTHRGPFPTPKGEIAPTGKALTWRFAALFDVEENRATSLRLYFDQVEILSQIGVIPT